MVIPKKNKGNGDPDQQFESGYLDMSDFYMAVTLQQPSWNEALN